MDNQRLFLPLLSDNGKNSEVSFHFGHAPYFGLYDFENKYLEIIKNNLDHGNAEKSPVDQIIESMNPTVVFAQDIGMRAINLFRENKIDLKTGPYKTVKEIVYNFDKLESLNNSCGH
jgi:predicted Fe-Mo cluster-binding NifX family protein